jgi:hypothetical protein
LEEDIEKFAFPDVGNEKAGGATSGGGNVALCEEGDVAFGAGDGIVFDEGTGIVF